jgi:hypothetical protein
LSLPRLTLTRFESGNQGTFGHIQLPGMWFLTGELPWRFNTPNKSCLPAGVYLTQWQWSPRFRRDTYLLESTAPRVGIRLHPANLMGDSALGLYSQLNGCIAIGEKLGWMSGQKALLLSAPAVRRFETHMNKQPFELEIVNA